MRINLIHPEKLSDQHLIAEYYEILMLADYVRRYPCIKDIPSSYCLGKGHVKFFKNKLKYLKNRHNLIKLEMKKRNFRPRKTLIISFFNKKNKNNWAPRSKDFKIIKKRIIEKIKLKPGYYRHYGKRKPVKFFIELLER